MAYTTSTARAANKTKRAYHKTSRSTRNQQKHQLQLVAESPFPIPEENFAMTLENDANDERKSAGFAALDKFQVDVPSAVCSLVMRHNAESDSEKPLPEDYEISDYDCVCGRGKGAYLRKGNQRARSIVINFAGDYRSAKSKCDKTAVLEAIVDEVRAQNNGRGRFVKRKQGRWYEITDVASREKVGHIMREVVSKIAHDEVEATPSSASTGTTRERRTTARTSGTRRKREVAEGCQRSRKAAKKQKLGLSCKPHVSTNDPAPALDLEVMDTDVFAQKLSNYIDVSESSSLDDEDCMETPEAVFSMDFFPEESHDGAETPPMRTFADTKQGALVVSPGNDDFGGFDFEKVSDDSPLPAELPPAEFPDDSLPIFIESQADIYCPIPRRLECAQAPVNQHYRPVSSESSLNNAHFAMQVASV